MTEKGNFMDQGNVTGSHSNSARGVAERVRDTATAQLSTQKTRATEQLGSIAQAVRQTSQPLRDNQQDAIAQFVEKAADQIERFSSQLRDKDIPELLDDAQRFARRQPAVFIGGAFALGIVAARFLKSSENRRDADAFPARMASRSGSFPAPTGAGFERPGYTGGER